MVLKLVPDEGLRFLLKAPAQHVTEAMHRISLVTAQVNAVFWSTQWSTHRQIILSHHLRACRGHPHAARIYAYALTQLRRTSFKPLSVVI